MSSTNNTLFKHKLNISKYASNTLMQIRLIYNFHNLYDVKIQVIFFNLLVQLNDPGLVGHTILICIWQLQSALYLYKSPLEYWSFDHIQTFHDSLSALLSVLPTFHLSLSLNSYWKYDIQEGFLPISSVLSLTQYLKILKLLKHHCLIFVKQLISQNGLYMIN